MSVASSHVLKQKKGGGGKIKKKNRKKASRKRHKLQCVHTAQHMGTFALTGTFPAATMAALAAVLFP